MPAGLEEALPSKTPAETISRWEMLRILTKTRERSSHPDEKPEAGNLPVFDGLDLDGPVDASTIEKLNVALHALAQEQQLQQESSISEPRQQANAPSKLRSLMLPLAVAQAEHSDAVDLASGDLDPDMLFVEPAALKRSASAPSARKGHIRSGRDVASTSKFDQRGAANKKSQITNAAARMNPRHFQGPSAAHGTLSPSSAGARIPAPERMGGDARQSQQERAGKPPSQRRWPRGDRTHDSAQTPTERPNKGSPQERMSPANNPPPFESSPERAGADHIPGGKRQQERGPLNKRLSGVKFENQPLRDPQEKGKMGQVPSLQNLRAPASHGTQNSAGDVNPSASTRLPPASNLPSGRLGSTKGQLGRQQRLPPKPLSRSPGLGPTGQPVISGPQPSGKKSPVSEDSGNIRDQHRPKATGVPSVPTDSRIKSKLDGSSGSTLRHLQTSFPSQAALIPAQCPLPARQAAPMPSSLSQRPTAPGIEPDLLAVHEAPQRPQPQQEAALSNLGDGQMIFHPLSPAAGQAMPGSTRKRTERNQEKASAAPPRSNIATGMPLGEPQLAGPNAGIQPPPVKTRQPETRAVGNRPPTAPEFHQHVPRGDSIIERNPSPSPKRSKQPTQSQPQHPEDSNLPSAHGTIDPADDQREDEDIEASLPSASIELVEGDFTADEMFELFLTGRFPQDLSSQVNRFSILQLMARGALYSAQGWLGKETRKASVAIAEGFGLI
ncbi:hypothetical protein D0867_03151 [Hortaea werneckii]|uniref:Uncharacterized protein n=1 Tax=Hortaea werneckii TaxID=91943 RepID=A0A3M7BCK9_HORWE|nr:hypothetical protein D0867_03151 [Hortaea werneckii]RMY37404.1 hypothetical protein D0866_03290 [Hortaea werneckii]